MDKQKKIVIILTVLTIVFVILGSTFAYFRWVSATNEQTNVTFTVSSGFSCSADGGGSITTQQKTLAPTSCTNSTYAFQRTIHTNVNNTSGRTVYYDLWLDVNTIGANLSASENFKYALTQQANDCTSNVISSGTFSGMSSGSVATLLIGVSNKYLSSSSGTYYLYVWLDAAETNNNTQNQSFSISLNGRCSDVLYGDVDGNGRVNNSDVAALLRSNNLQVADVNVDGVIDVADRDMVSAFVHARGQNLILGPH